MTSIATAHESHERGTVANKPQSLVADSIVSDAVWYLNNEVSGTSLTDILGKITAPTLTISGTDAANRLSENEPWLTQADSGVPPTSDNYVKTTDAEIDALMRLDNLTGGLLVAFDYYKAASPTTGTPFIIGAGRYGATNDIGGWGLFDQTTDRIRMEIYSQDGTNTDLLQGGAGTCDPLVRHSITLFFDVANLQVSMYIDGVIQDTVAMPTSGGLPTAFGSYGLTLLAKCQSGTPNNNAQDGVRMKSLFILRSDNDISADISSIASELYTRQNRLGWTLEGK